MKPAPPEIIKIKKDNYEIISEPSNVSNRDITTIKSIKMIKNEVLWSFDEYIGRKDVFISPDGLTLVLFGSKHFGSTIKTDEESAVLEVVQKSANTNLSFNYKQITGHSLAKAIKKNDLGVLGGGWVRLNGVLKIEKVDWENRVIKFNQIDFKF
jgi:hypothetical protein